jgi:diguanylate cyclase (GGDEF)-like protein
MKILLVDDTLTERLIMSSYLKKMGHEVVLGENGRQAIDLYHEHHPDLLIMDVIMPVMDGHEAARAIRGQTEDWVPIIFLSARSEPEDIASGIEAGGDDYLTKPVSEIVLTAKMTAMQRIAGMRHKLLSVSLELEKANARLRTLADVDGLTGLSNRRHLDKHLSTAMEKCKLEQRPISVALLDVDHFKNYNDYYGHPAGDSCLKKIAKAIKRNVTRPQDLAGRFGGEEFCIVLPDTRLDDARKVVENIRESVSKLAIPHLRNGDKKQVTFSAGVSEIEGGEGTPEMILANADKALYLAKDAGRDQIKLATE